MTKSKKELIDESSTLSSARWSLVTCVKWGIILAVIAIISVIICNIIKRPLYDGFLSGCAILIGLILGIPTAGKATQSFSEYGNNYFDKFENLKTVKKEQGENENGK
jgi:xanthine/uracil permease